LHANTERLRRKLKDHPLAEGINFPLDPVGKADIEEIPPAVHDKSVQGLEMLMFPVGGYVYEKYLLVFRKIA
jgi:hypothetical protein